MNRIRSILTASAAVLLLTCKIGTSQNVSSTLPETGPPAFIVPNFHPASCGWLTNWSTERNYCANSYLSHLDRVRDDASYRFVLSECNNMIAIQNFAPDRFAELKTRLKEGRVELPNAFFLESTINLSGGEALVKMGIEGLRWQQQVMGVTPRFAWTIDVCGTHEQMPQICKGLGLDGMIYTRCNKAGKTVFWSEAPDGSRILTFVPGHYSDFGQVFRAKESLTETELGELQSNLAKKAETTPAGLPLLVLGGNGDYSLAPVNPGNPAGFMKQWKNAYPDKLIRFSTFSDYFDAVRSSLLAGKTELPVVTGGTSYTFDSFWIECPKVKSWYRRNEHSLQAAEMLSAIASLKTDFQYPVQPLYNSWLLMLLNMDRNTLWGSAGGMVFEHETSWDARDRFEWVENRTKTIQENTLQMLAGKGEATAIFNPSNWTRNDPVRLRLPGEYSPDGYTSEALPDGSILCQPEVPSVGISGIKLRKKPAPVPKPIALPETIETEYYTIRLDRATGGIASLKMKPSGKEMLGGPANVLVAEQRTGRGDPGDFTNPRPQRPELARSGNYKPTFSVTEGPLAITVTVKSEFYGGASSTRIMRFYKKYPRIDFETELNDIPDLTVVVAEIPLAEKPLEIRRGIPYGFSHAPWSKPNNNLPGLPEGIKPAVRWSDYSFEGGNGIAILDRGLSGREINDKTPVIFLYNATEKYYGYPNSWLSGKGKHLLEYALVLHDGNWNNARIPQMAWEYNCPVVQVPDCGTQNRGSYLKTSGNVIVEAFRRETSEIELRLSECYGEPGVASVELKLPHISAAITDMLGKNPQTLAGHGTYSFPVRPQQIVTLRFRTQSAVDPVKPLLAWDEMVPPAKREALNTYLKDKKGHPPRGN